jgi:hypothetical protein
VIDRQLAAILPKVDTPIELFAISRVSEKSFSTATLAFSEGNLEAEKNNEDQRIKHGWSKCLKFPKIKIYENYKILLSQLPKSLLPFCRSDENCSTSFNFFSFRSSIHPFDVGSYLPTHFSLWWARAAHLSGVASPLSPPFSLSLSLALSFLSLALSLFLSLCPAYGLSLLIRLSFCLSFYKNLCAGLRVFIFHFLSFSFSLTFRHSQAVTFLNSRFL